MVKWSSKSFGAKWSTVLFECLLYCNRYILHDLGLYSNCGDHFSRCLQLYDISLAEMHFKLPNKLIINKIYKRFNSEN